MKRPDHGSQNSLDRVRHARHNPTEPEKRLWSRVRNRQVAGLKFRRQTWIGPYITDFVSIEVRLVVEVDGDTHAATEQADAERTAFLESEGFRVIRFGNADVMTNIEGVVEEIMAAVRNRPSPSHRFAAGSTLSPDGERGK